jgi:hypothetical protein
VIGLNENKGRLLRLAPPVNEEKYLAQRVWVVEHEVVHIKRKGKPAKVEADRFAGGVQSHSGSVLIPVGQDHVLVPQPFINEAPERRSVGSNWCGGGDGVVIPKNCPFLVQKMLARFSHLSLLLNSALVARDSYGPPHHTQRTCASEWCLHRLGNRALE